MPKFIQAFTYLVPARYYITILRELFLKGGGMSSMWDETLFLALFAFFMLGFSIRRFRKKVA
jgi:ABC-2 type transport system permease protein